MSTIDRHAGSVPRPPARRLALRLAALFAAAAAVWAIIAPWCTRRDLLLELSTSAPTSRWRLDWSGSDAARRNGRWLDLAGRWREPEELLIRPSGQPGDGGAGFEFWLLRVEPLGAGVPAGPGGSPAPAVDLGGVNLAVPGDSAAAGGDVQGEWIRVQGGPGLVYLGRSPGLLKLKVPAGGVRLTVPRQPRGGKVLVQYADDTAEVDTFAPRWQEQRVALFRRSLPATGWLAAAEVLPAYARGAATLRWEGGEGQTGDAAGMVKVHRARSRWSVLGVRLPSRVCEVWRLNEPAAVGSGAAGGGWGVGVSIGPLAGPGVAAHAVGLGISSAVIALAILLIGPARRAAGYVRAHAAAMLDGLAAALVIGVNARIAWWSPLFVTGDGVDYLTGGAGLAWDGTIRDFSRYKAPGMTVILAACMRWFTDYLVVFGWLQAGFGVVTASLVYLGLRRVASRGRARLGGLLCGLNPALITCGCYLLRESVSALVMTALACLLVLGATPPAGRGGTAARRGLLFAACVGLLAGVGALLRENFQSLLVLAPLALLVPTPRPGDGWRRRAGRVALAAAVGAACVAPWMAWNAAVYGRWSMTAPKTQMNRGLNAWLSGVIDPDQTAVFSAEGWEAFRREQAATPLSDFGFMHRAFVAAEELEPAGAQGDAAAGAAGNPVTRMGTSRAERVGRLLVDESIARDAPRALRASVAAFVHQIGLWNLYSLPHAASIEWMSRPLRGQPFDATTNYIIDVEATTLISLTAAQQDRLRAIAGETTVPLSGLAGSVTAAWFRELFWGHQLARPLLAGAFLFGAARACRRREAGMIAVSAIVLVNIVGGAVLVMTPTDRYAVAFTPAMILVALWGFPSRRVAEGAGGRPLPGAVPGPGAPAA